MPKRRGTQHLCHVPISVPGTGLEPVRPQWSRDFKSLVSTNSTIWATASVCKDTVFSLNAQLLDDKNLIM